MRTVDSNPRRPTGWLALGLLAGCLLTPSVSQAGCAADRRAVPSGDRSRFESLERNGALATVEYMASHDREPSRPSPCMGLSCSRDVDPPTVPATEFRTTPAEKAFLDRSNTRISQAAWRAEYGDATLQPVRAMSVVFHPPRPAAVAG